MNICLWRVEWWHLRLLKLKPMMSHGTGTTATLRILAPLIGTKTTLLFHLSSASTSTSTTTVSSLSAVAIPVLHSFYFDYVPSFVDDFNCSIDFAAFSEYMVGDGYEDFVNIDISSVVIEAMQKKYSNRPHLTCVYLLFVWANLQFMIFYDCSSLIKDNIVNLHISYKPKEWDTLRSLHWESKVRLLLFL